MGRIFATISGKGGTGKSTFSVGVATALSDYGQKVLVIDLDSGLRCLDILFGVEKDIVFDLGDVFEGNEVSDSVYDIPALKGVQLIPAPQNAADFSAGNFCALLQGLSESYDVILLDFPAGIDTKLVSALSKQAEFITVCTPDPVSVRDAAAVCLLLENVGASARLVINRFDLECVKSGDCVNIDDAIDGTGMRLIGIVPQDNSLALLGMRNKIPKRSGASKAFHRIAQRMLGREVKLPKPRKI